MRDDRDDERQKRADARDAQPMGEPAADEKKRESGQPGGGQGRRDVVGEGEAAEHGVRPLSAGTRPGGDAELRGMMAWGQGERGAAGYEDSGGSELVWREGQLLGGLTAGPSGAPTMDIHGGPKPPTPPAAPPATPPGAPAASAPDRQREGGQEGDADETRESGH